MASTTSISLRECTSTLCGGGDVTAIRELTRNTHCSSPMEIGLRRERHIYETQVEGLQMAVSKGLTVAGNKAQAAGRVTYWQSEIKAKHQWLQLRHQDSQANADIVL